MRALCVNGTRLHPVQQTFEWESDRYARCVSMLRLILLLKKIAMLNLTCCVSLINIIM